MGAGLSGNLRDFGIADVFQLIGQQRKTGVLELANAQARVQLVFDAGAVVTASPASGRSGDGDSLCDMMVRCGLLTRKQADQAIDAARSSAAQVASIVAERGWVDAAEVGRVEALLTKDTIFEVLRWEAGTFDFHAQTVEHGRDRSSLLGAEQILMDGLRMIDEWRSFSALVASDAIVFQRVGRFEAYLERKGYEGEQLECAKRVFSLIDGRLPVRRVVDLSRLGTFDGTRFLAELVQEGVIRPLHPEGVRHLRKQERPGAGSGGSALSRIGGLVSGVVGVALPLALLVAATWMAQSPAPAGVEPGLDVGALERLREAYATRRVRNAIDAYRLGEGRWPDVHRDLPADGYLDEASLAAPEGRPYYSVNREDGVVFLAPEH